MKFSALVALLPLLFSSSVLAISRDVIQARQAHVKKDLIDVCVALDVDVNIAPAGVNILAGHIDLCLCLSVLPGFLNSNSVAKNVANHLGKDGACDYFTKLIQSQKNKQQCHYPAHATPFCSIQRPCDFQCGNGYTPFPPTNPTQCVCKAPNTECNGVCGSFPHGCSSQALSKSRRDQPICSASQTMCGVPNGEGVDCVDTFTNPESCGGCTVASPFGNNGASGKNCRALPNVGDARCNSGSCEILSCKPGFNLSPNGGGCVKPRFNRIRKARGVDIVDDCFDRLQRNQLLAPGFDIVSAKAKILATVLVLDYDHVLQALIFQGAVINIVDLVELKDKLGLGVSVLRRGGSDTVDYVLGLLLKSNLIVGFHDLASVKAFLGATVLALDVDHLLALLIGQKLIVQVTDVIQLKEMLGLGVAIL